ncbi:MAG TPA: Gfo/Idh/MocA family oxidoreductase [Opitutaceae bacterium]|nr:Gfo/Idh/MocA family oxidoreductase [Opitutaceae bacterium]HRJ46931.1 Gfo/Idh/MocA family oxidoreductase [Opitutaceae bacterium]
MRKIRFGITGSGYMARTHGEAIRQLGEVADLVALWGGSRAAGLAAHLGVTNEPSLETLMARRDIDAVVVTTPHHLHARETILALESGKHVLIEKPMATSVEDCDRIIAAAARRGSTIGVAYNLRFRNNLPRARELIAAGAIGRVQSLHYSMIRQLASMGNFGGNKLGWVSQPESIGFVLGGLTHGIDAIRWATGAEVTRALGFSRTYTPGRGNEDTTVGIMEFSNGAVCSVHTTTAAHGEFPGEMARLQLIGSAGSLDLDTFGDLHLTDRARGWRLVTTQPPVLPDDPDEAFKGGRMQAFRDQLRSFIDGIHGGPMRTASGADGRAGVTACLAMLASSQQNRAVIPA